MKTPIFRILSRFLFAGLTGLILVPNASARVFLTTNSTWRYFKGTSEASTPTNAWRQLDFDDSAWLAGAAPFHYGTNSAGGDDNQFGGTILSDMRSNYTCIFLRQAFVIPNTNMVLTLNLGTYMDDGLVAWLNGVELPRQNAPYTGALSHTNTARTSVEVTRRTVSLTSFLGALRNGTNVLAVQALNVNQTNDDFRIDLELAEAPSTFQFAAATTTVPETGGQAVLRVLRSNSLEGGVTVDYATTNGTALAGADYVATNSTLTFAEGQTEQTVVLPILNDGMAESTEYFEIKLSNPGGGAVLGTVTNTTVTIQDNDKGLQFELAAYSVNEDAGEVRIRIVRGDDEDFPVSVDYATVNLTATAGQDYIERVGTLTFESGEAVKYLIVPLVNDAVQESAKAFRVVLSNLTGGSVLGAPNMTSVTITDTDEVVQFEFTSYPTPEDAAYVQVGLIRGENESEATVNLRTANGTATAGLDYEGMTNTIHWGDGERLKRVNIPILNDELWEANQTFSLTLSSPTGGAVLGSPGTATVTIIDNDPGIGFERSTNTVWENWGVANVNVLRGNDQLLGAFTVNYGTADGSARAGVDYEPVSGTLEFKANETIRCLTIPLLPGPTAGMEKYFTVMLSNATGGIPLGPAAVTRVSIGRSYPLAPSLDTRLKIRRAEQLNVLTWEGNGSMLRADQVSGPWEEFAGGRNLYASRPLLPARFYRIQSSRPTTVYVPSRYDGQTPLPLVVVLHGYGDNYVWMTNYFRFQPVAESRGLLLCYPEGIPDSQGSRFWNATDACCDFYGAGEDDSAYLRGLIEDIVHRFAVDRKRIYVTGFSNGGYMSHRMACDHADLIAGIAGFAGTTFLDPNSHRPSQPVHVLHIHGTADVGVPYAGGALTGLPVVALFPGAVKTVQTWAQLNGCQGPVVEPTPSLHLTVGAARLDTTVMRYTHSPPGGAVELWTIHGAAHRPTLSSEFPERVIDWLLAHPKP